MVFSQKIFTNDIIIFNPEHKSDEFACGRVFCAPKNVYRRYTTYHNGAVLVKQMVSVTI